MIRVKPVYGPVEKALDEADAYAAAHPGDTMTHEEVFEHLRKKLEEICRTQTLPHHRSPSIPSPRFLTNYDFEP